MEFSENISGVRVLVVGDLMLDRYWWGNVSRISPEAPVPVVNLENVSATLGGAANVAANVAGLGAEPFLVGVVGEDEEATAVAEALKSKNISDKFLIRSSERRTTVKTRIVAHNQQIVRIDRETKNNLSFQEEEAIWERAADLITRVEIVILSDYAKGVLTENLTARLITKTRKENKKVFVDPKGKNFLKYQHATMLTPNRSEFFEACDLNGGDKRIVEQKGKELLSELGLEYLLVTQGEDGMMLFEKDRETTHLPVEQRNVYDVTGAGDTVIGCLAVATAAGADFLTAATFANRAAGLVIEKVGTTAISSEMLK